MLLKWVVRISALVMLVQPALASAADTPSAVVAKKVGAGWVFTDQKGMSLYTYAQDKPGQSSG
jgi:predicted lipoprotein with Yx(FWY)xxD motif